MRLNLIVSAALLSLLTGVLVWALRPTHKVFSWVELSSRDYLIGYLPGRGQPFGEAQVTLEDYADAIEDLESRVPGDYAPFAAVGRMGRRVHLPSGESFPLFREEYVSANYFEARRVHAEEGRLLRPGETGSVVIGHLLAREHFDRPSDAVGETVNLKRPGAEGAGEQVEIVGVLAPSPAQDPDIDTDEALIGTLDSQLQPGSILASMPLFLHATFHDEADARRLVPRIEPWAESYFGSGGGVAAANSFVERRRARIEQTRPRVEARRHTFLGFAAALIASALFALYGQSYLHLLRRRQLLGVEKALGATRRQLALRLVGAQVPWGVVGGLLGWIGLWSLYDILPRAFLTRPPPAVLAAAMGAPMIALLLLAALVSVPVLTQPSMALLRGRVKSRRVRSLLVLVYGGLALALAGGLAANEVYLQVQRESGALEGHFGRMYALQAGDPVIDDRVSRAFEAGGGFSPVFSSRDARELEGLAGVEAATVAQSIPELGVTHEAKSRALSAVVGDSDYLPFMALPLLAGDPSGCVLSEDAVGDLGVAIGQTITLAGLTGPIPCRVSGVLQQPPAVWSWLVEDLPQIVAPPMDGLGLPLPGYTATPFGSTRILARLATPDGERAIEVWQARHHPEVEAEVVPYTPDVEVLLANLRGQAQLFLLIALLAGALSVWGIVGGFLALLEAERFRIAVDRALGLSIQRIAWTWWLQTLALALISGVVGVLMAAFFAHRLYNALALDIPNLPSRDVLGVSSEIILAIGLGLVALSGALTWMMARRIRRRSAMSQLKEGTA